MHGYLIPNLDPKTIHQKSVIAQCQICGRQATLGPARPFSQLPPDGSGSVTIEVPVASMDNALGCGHGNASGVVVTTAGGQ